MLDVLRMVILLLNAIGIGAWLYWGKCNKRWHDAIVPLLWLIHAMLYNVTLMFIPIPADTRIWLFNNWSTVLRLHMVIMLVGMGLAELVFCRGRKRE